MSAKDDLLGEWTSIMGDRGRGDLVGWWALALVFGLFVCWLLVLSRTASGRQISAALCNILPGWLVAGNLVVAPCLMALAAGPLRMSLLVRLLLASLMLASILIAQITFTRFLIASCVVLVIMLLEAYWFIPKWTARPGRVP
jgi:hypothetical protein